MISEFLGIGRSFHVSWYNVRIRGRATLVNYFFYHSHAYIATCSLVSDDFDRHA